MLVRQRAALMDFTPTLRQMGLCTAPAVPTGRQWLISQRKMACCLQSALGLVCVQLRNNFFRSVPWCNRPFSRRLLRRARSALEPAQHKGSQRRAILSGIMECGCSTESFFYIHNELERVARGNPDRGLHVRLLRCVLSPAPSLPLPPQFHPSVFIQARVTCKCAI